ncbi:TetR/AcrR family transcriptional regulator [Aneurinibacillus uraniidurans]|uniref:TetR/AcrR family transcriptional regulator n=1 Tax=Aneurinibacillus uraniidurans TaxID=2966586 RepID=UPI00234B29B5|nr:TetR/AcrR family transcriptional regulator [Aneurinibacillus sp. B1]WCN36939.1 TetR/AcrR family transcriptional regulator [Aneurinibacillus sp. B1]
MDKKYSPRVKRTREKILNSAVEIFSQKGFQASTIREIARLAGVNDLTVYRHFESKEKLFSEMFQRHTLLSEISSLVIRGVNDDFEHDLRSLVVAFLAIFKKEMPMIRLLITEAEKMSECKKYAAMFTENIIEQLTQFLRYYQQTNQIRSEVNCQAVATSLYSTLFVHIYSMVLYGDAVEALDASLEETMINGWIDLYVSGSTSGEYASVQ